MMMAVFMVVVRRCWQPGEALHVDDDADDVDDDDGCLHGCGPQVLATW